jgi:hypothetical protein
VQRLDPVVEGQTEEDRAHGLAVLLGRAGNARDGNADIGAQHLARALGHRDRRLLGDHRPAGHAQEVELHLGVVGNDGAAEEPAGTCHRCQPGAHEAAGERLRDTERQLVGIQQHGDRVLHALVVGTEDERAQQRAQLVLLGLQEVSGGGLIGALGRDADLDALDAAGQEGDRGVAEGIEGGHPRSHHLRQRRLRRSPGAQGATEDDGGLSRSPLQVGEHRRAHHRLHLVGNAGYGVDHLVTDRADEAGCGAEGVRDEVGSLRPIGLALVRHRHVSAAAAEHGADLLDDRGVAHEADVHHLGDGLARDVVLRGPEATAHDDRVAARQRAADGEHHARLVVAHLGLEVGVDPGQRELLPDPRRVGVDHLSEQQLGADGDDLTPH